MSVDGWMDGWMDGLWCGVVWCNVVWCGGDFVLLLIEVLIEH